MASSNITFRPGNEDDRKFLENAAKLAGAGNASVLLRNIVAALRTMTPEELRALNTRAAEKEASAT